jgi:2-dehydro-3-deoxyphosphogluconate aldolase/(4S)-4-hydroxy-2-oxoglutarate aldolase
MRRTDKRHRAERPGKKIDFLPPPLLHTVTPLVKRNVLSQFRAEKVIGLAPADLGPELINCARALSAGGINSLEIAMTTPAALRWLEEAHAALPDFAFGLGTVLDVDTARLAILAGVSFIVTPSPRPAVTTLCRRYHVPVISGAFSSADIVAAHAAGAAAAKVFPGEHFGPTYIKSLKELRPDIDLIPIGGVTPETVAEFLRAGALATIAGSSLIEEDACRRRAWDEVTHRARLFVAALGG